MQQMRILNNQIVSKNDCMAQKSLKMQNINCTISLHVVSKKHMSMYTSKKKKKVHRSGPYF